MIIILFYLGPVSLAHIFYHKYVLNIDNFVRYMKVITYVGSRRLVGSIDQAYSIGF